jgi:hypothetical protein
MHFHGSHEEILVDIQVDDMPRVQMPVRKYYVTLGLHKPAQKVRVGFIGRNGPTASIYMRTPFLPVDLVR